jgi:thymidylate synthase (FAD)
MEVKLISITPDAEKLIAYCARVSNPNGQGRDDYSKLISYCIKNQHWSIFEQGYITVEITTTRAIAAQILRHRSFTFQEFSQRYADAKLLGKIECPDIRSQDNKNRQNSIDDIQPHIKNYWKRVIEEHFYKSVRLYESLLKDGVAKECARFVLPLATPTKLYMTGSIRSWIHYIELRSSNGTQKEHMDIANSIKQIFVEQLPIISEALDWNYD